MKIELKAVDGAKKEVRDLLYVLQLECLPADKPTKTDRGWWWIMYDGITPIGFAGMYKSASWLGTGYLCRAGLVVDYRGKGLQKKLIRVRERAARKLGFTHLVSDTFDNPPSANNLIACGYKMYLPRTPWGGSGVVYWIKRLKKETT